MSPEECIAEYNRLKGRVMRKEENVPAGARKANKHYRPWEETAATDSSGQTSDNRSDVFAIQPQGGGDSTERGGEGLFKGIPYTTIIDRWWQLTGGVPQEGERNVRLYQLAVNLRAICDNKPERLMAVMPRLGLDEQELRSIVESACKEQPKGISKLMREAMGTQKEPHSMLNSKH